MMGGRSCLLALAASGGRRHRTVFRRWGSRELRDGTCVRLDDTIFFPLAGKFVSSNKQLVGDLPRWWFVGRPDVGHLLLGELAVSPVFTVIPFEGFGNDFGVPSSMDPRYNVFDFLIVVLAVFNHLEVRHDDVRV